MRCPACGAELRAFDTTAGRVLRCRQGHGTSINLAVLRRRFDESVALWRAASRQPQGDRACPSCTRPMRVFSWEAQQQVELDACSTCQLVWFDATEIEALKIRLVERAPGVAPPLAAPHTGAPLEATAENNWLAQRAGNVLDGLDLFDLLDFFDF